MDFGQFQRRLQRDARHGLGERVWRRLPSTEIDEALAWLARAREVARDTGRVVFGQLWLPEPTNTTVMDLTLRSVYGPLIAEMINTPSPFYQRAHREP